MEQHVTVIPDDNTIMVNGESLTFDFAYPSGLHALQWHNGAGETEWNHAPNQTISDYETEVAPFVLLWEEERARQQAAAQLPPPTLEEARIAARMAVDAATSAAILAGFDAEALPPEGNTPEVLHFSYNSFDQQNFADSAIAMQLGAAAGEDSSIPASTPWNAYRNWTPDSGGELVVLQLNAETFLPVYAAALNHKAARMAEGSTRKTAIEAADSVEAIQAMLAEWGL